MDKLLPIGSIVHIKESKCYTMIMGYCKPIQNGEDIDWYEYMGCIHPVGFADINANIVFHPEDIDEVIFEGMKNDDYEARVKEVQEFMDSLKASK